MLEADPFEPRAAAQLVAQLKQTGRGAEADALVARFERAISERGR